MARAKIHVGLEIGTSKVCMVVGEVKSDGSVKILGLGTAKSAGVRKGEICDYAKIKNCVEEARHKAEEASDVEIGSVFLSVSGAHYSGTNNTGTYRLPENEKQIRPEHFRQRSLHTVLPRCVPDLCLCQRPRRRFCRLCQAPRDAAAHHLLD